MKIINITANAAAVGHERLLKNSFHITRPIVKVCAPPRSSGITNSPIEGIKTIAEPAIIPGMDSGKMTVKKVLNGEQPRSYAASTIEKSSFCRIFNHLA